MSALPPLCGLKSDISRSPRSAMRRHRLAYSTNPWARTECCRLLVRYNSDAAEFALLNEVDKSNVGLVKCIVSHGRSGLPRFLAQPLVHGEPFFENGPPFFGQVSDRRHP